MTDSDSLRGDIDRHTHLPQCCGELETLRALLRPRMADAGDPTPTEALRGMFIEIERLRATTSESTRCQALEDQLANAIEDRTVAKHALQSLRGRLHELLQLSMDGASDRDIFERIESLKVKLAEERKRTNMLAEQATAERRLASAAAEGHDHARALLVEIAEVFGRVDDFDAIPKMVKELDDARRAALAKVERLQDRVDEQDKERVIRALPVSLEAIRESPCPMLDEACHVRAGRPRFLTVDQKLEVWLIEPTALPGYVISGRNDHWQWNNDAHSTCIAGYKSAIEAIAGARENSKATQIRVGLEIEKLVAALNEKTAALDVADAHFSSLKRGSDEAHAALATLGWDGNSYPEDWAKTTAAHYKAVREALGVPAGKPIVAYAQHAAKGMQALAILGWQDGSPVEWATKHAAAEADLRGALAEAELVGNDHAAMVRQLWGNLRSKSAQHLAAIEERNAQVDECAILRTVITEREGRIELAEKRLSTWRAWAAGMCPATPPPANMTDEDLRAAMTFVSVADYNRAIKAVQDELARQRSLVSVMVDIKRRLIALKDLSS